MFLFLWYVRCLARKHCNWGTSLCAPPYFPSSSYTPYKFSLCSTANGLGCCTRCCLFYLWSCYDQWSIRIIFFFFFVTYSLKEKFRVIIFSDSAVGALFVKEWVFKTKIKREEKKIVWNVMIVIFLYVSEYTNSDNIFINYLYVLWVVCADS